MSCPFFIYIDYQYLCDDVVTSKFIRQRAFIYIYMFVCVHSSLEPSDFSYDVILHRSPSGKLVQIEHALTAVGSGQTSLGIKGNSILL